MDKFINGYKHSPRTQKKELEYEGMTSHDKVTEKNQSEDPTPNNRRESELKHKEILSS